MSAVVGPALSIAVKDLRLRLRDRSALVVAFVAPVVIAAIVSLALGSSTSSFRAIFAVADLDEGPLGPAFVDGLRAPGLRDVVTVREAADGTDARDLVAADQAGAAFVIPSGFSRAVQAGTGARISVLRSADHVVAGEVASAIAESFAARLAAPPAPGAVALVDGAIGRREVKAASYFGPSMAIFFLFFTVEFGALGILAERRQATLSRLLAAPIAREAVILGKALATFVLGVASLVVTAVATSVLLGASWGDPLAVGALIAAIVLAAMAITALSATFASTEERAGGFASIVTMGLAMLGGNFIPIDAAPPVMQTLAALTPNGLALRGFTDLVADGGGVTTILPSLAGILAFALLCGVPAVIRSRTLVLA